MLKLFASNWYVFGPLFLAFNICLGLFFVWIAEYSPAAGFWQRCSGVASPVIGTLALMFGLYSAFLANDVWAMHDKARSAVLREEAAIRVLLRVAESAGPQGQHLRELVGDYARASTAGDWMNQLDHPASIAVIRSLLHEGLFGPIAKAGPEVQRTAMGALMELRAGHLDRVALATATAGEGKWSAVFMFGVLTQITMVAIHLGRARASALAVTLFSIGMTISMLIILQFSQPFHGPHAVSLRPIQEALERASQPVETDLPGPGAGAPNAPATEAGLTPR
jgi:hypothetical protein